MRIAILSGEHELIWQCPYIAQLAAQENVTIKERLRYFRAFDFNSGPAKSKLLLDIDRTQSQKRYSLK